MGIAGLPDFTDFSGGGLGDPFGTGAAKSANAANAKRYSQAIGQTNIWQSQLDPSFNASQNWLLKALGATNRGYGQARTGLQYAGQSAKQGIQDRGAQNLASSQQSLASRGLYNTTAFDAAQRGVHADTSRALASVDENLGSLLANLNIGQAQSQAGIYGGLSGLEQNRFGVLGDIYKTRTNIMASRNDVAAPGWLSQLIGPAAQVGTAALLA